MINVVLDRLREYYDIVSVSKEVRHLYLDKAMSSVSWNVEGAFVNPNGILLNW